MKVGYYCFFIFTLLFFISCKKNQESEYPNRYAKPEETEIILLFQSGETEIRTSMENHRPEAGEIFSADASLITGNSGTLLIQDSRGNLILLFPESHLSIFPEKGKINFQLHQGAIEVSAPESLQISTEEFLVFLNKGIAGIETSHQEGKIYNYSSEIDLLMGNLPAENINWLNQEPESRIAQVFNQVPITLEPGKQYQWFHNRYRDYSRHLGTLSYEINQTDQDQEEILKLLRISGERPEPDVLTISRSSRLKQIRDYLEINLHNRETLFHLIEADPLETEIQTGPFSGFGTMEIPLLPGNESLVQFHLRGYEEQEIPIQSISNTKVIMQRKSSQTYHIQVYPEDARIYINDLFAGKGQLVLTQKPGEEILLRCELEEYNNQEILLDDIGLYPENLEIHLKKTLLGRYFVSYEDPIGIAFLEDMIIVADRKGNITSVLQNRGVRPWGYATANSPNDWSSPVIAFDQVYFSGKRTLSVFDPISREVTGVFSLNRRSSHQYGRRVTPFGNTIALPTDDSIILLTADLSSVLKVIDIPGGLLMTPLNYQDLLYCVSADGRIYKIDRSGQIITTGFSNAFSPTAMTIALSENRGYFSDKRGLLTCFDLDSLEVLWEQSIPDKSRLVFRDLIVDRDKLYLYSEGYLYQFDADRGDFLDVMEYRFLTPPLVEKQLLYGAVSDNRFIIMDMLNGMIIEEIETSAPVCSAVFSYQGIAVAGMKNGRILIMNQPINP